MDEGGGDVEPAPHAARVRADHAAEGVADVDEYRQLAQPLVDLTGSQPVQAALQAEQLFTGLLRVEGDVLERHPDPEPDLVGVIDDVVAGHDRTAGRRTEQRAQHAHRRRLAGAVGAEEAVDLATADTEVESVDRGHVGEGSGQAGRGDGRTGIGRGTGRHGVAPLGGHQHVLIRCCLQRYDRTLLNRVSICRKTTSVLLAGREHCAAR